MLPNREGVMAAGFNPTMHRDDCITAELLAALTLHPEDDSILELREQMIICH